MVEEEADRSTGFTGTTMTRIERRTWSEMMMGHGLKDIHRSEDFIKSSLKHFTWQGTRRGEPVLSRIDRYYANQGILALGGNTGTWPTLLGISDHAPVHCQINKIISLPKKLPAFHTPMLHAQARHALLKQAWTAGLNKSRMERGQQESKGPSTTPSDAATFINAKTQRSGS